MQEKIGEGKLDQGGRGSSCEERSKSRWTSEGADGTC